MIVLDSLVCYQYCDHEFFILEPLFGLRWSDLVKLSANLSPFMFKLHTGCVSSDSPRIFSCTVGLHWSGLVRSSLNLPLVLLGLRWLAFVGPLTFHVYFLDRDISELSL